MWEAGETLDGVSGDQGWEEVTDRLDPVLAEHGFEDLGAPTRSGALYSVSTTTGTAPSWCSTSRGGSLSRGALIDTTTCTKSALGL